MDKAKRDLYLKQVTLLKTFLSTGAISQAQYDKSFMCMTEKMGMEDVSCDEVYGEDDNVKGSGWKMKNNCNKEAIIFIGIQASGKSSYYRQCFSGYVHVSLDTLHTRNKEKLLIIECIQEGKSFVVDNTNPTIQDREKYIRLAKENGYSVHGYYFQSAIADCMERNRQREGKARVPDKALACTHSNLELPKHEEGFDKLYYVQIVDGKFVTEEWTEK